MKKERKMDIEKIVYSILRILLICFLGCQIWIIASGNLQLSGLYNYNYLGIAMLIVFGGRLLYAYLVKCPERKRLVVLFMLTLFPRVILGCIYEYVPTNDFANYFAFGYNTAYDLETGIVQAVNTYGMPEMGGLAVFEGIISWLFRGRITGFVFCNSIMAAFSTILIYLIGRNYNKEIGILGGLLFAIYPMGIISAQITTNHHGAILFTLFAIYCFEKQYGGSLKKKIIFSVLSGISLVISSFWHASVIVPLIAIFCYGVMRCIRKPFEKKVLLSDIFNILRPLCIFAIVSSIAIGMITNIDGIQAKQTDFALKIYVGLNADSSGTYNTEDISHPEWDTNDTVSAIRERLQSYSVHDIIELFKAKMTIIWFGRDNYGDYYMDSIAQDYYVKEDHGDLTEQENQKYQKIFETLDDVRTIDMLYVNGLYIFMVIGAILRKRNKGNILDCALWVILGWIGVHIFIEVQPRYRYLAMPYIILYAAIGIYEVRHFYWKTLSNRKHSLEKTLQN